jgi:hypothetical protein
MKCLKIGEFWGKGKYSKRILDIKELSNGWYLIKTENSKSKDDFRVKVIFSLDPPRSMTPKHAHFLIDFYGKLCADSGKAKSILEAICEMWHHPENIDEIFRKYQKKIYGLPGYPFEYILYGLKWILEQEDINFKGRPSKKQAELDEICKKQNIITPENRKGSQLAISLLCDVANGTHPVESLLKANLDIRPKSK